VQAVNGSGSSALSAQVSGLTMPAAPTGLAATAASASQINLSWNAVSGASSYTVQRATVSGGPYTTVGSPTAASFADTGLSANTTYFYVVQAVNASGSSASSAQVSATTALATPTGLTATAASTTQINLSWNAVTGAASYTVERSTTSGGPYTSVGSPTTASFADTGLTAGTTYFYVVQAVNAAGSSALSAQVSAVTVPAAPTGVAATAASASQINLTWSAVTGATSYTVQRSTTSGGPYTTMGSPTSASFADTALSPATTYFYVVQAVNASGSSALSAQVSGLTMPATPTGVAATAASVSQINLTWNAVTGATSYSVQRSTTSGGPYTTVGSPTTTSFGDTGLSANTTYYYVVQAVDASGASASSAQVSASTALAAPNGVAATAASTTQINLSWNAVSGATSYTVQRATVSGGPYTTVASPTTASFADTGLSAGTTYFYVVQAVNASGSSALSAQVSATTVPAAPTGVAATAASASQINLTWNVVTGAASYTVQRSTTSGGPYTSVGSAATASFADTGLSPATTYFFVVQAVNASGSSALSAQVSGLTMPAAPTGLAATTASASQINLTWNAVSGATSYTVQRATVSGGPYTTVGSPAAASFADSGLSANTTYFYVVQAVNSSGPSASSAQASATTGLSAPTGVSATAASTTQINVSWNAVSGATSYTVQRATVSGGPYTTVGSPATASFADTGLTAGTTYFYVVQAVNAAGSSASSAQVSAITMPAAPTGVAATAASTSQINMTWNAVTGAASYTVQRATVSGGPYTTVGSPTTTSFADTGLSAGTTYFYVVTAVNASGSSALSAQVSATTVPAAPTGVAAAAASASQINLTWTAVTGAASYTVQRSTTSGGPYTTVGSPTTASFSDTGLAANTTYFYVVQAVNASGSSVSSAQVSGLTMPAAPTGVAATAASASQINLTWTAVTGAANYTVQRSTTSGGPYSTVGSPTTASFSDTGLAANTTYFYVVQAVNASGSSASSTQASATTGLAAPTGLAATAASASQINLTWNVVSGATSYTVQRATVSGGPYTTAGSPTTASFSDTGLSAGTTYFYVVAAANAAGSSALSAEVSAATMPAAPTGVVATAASASQISLTWNAVSGASSYTVQRATVSGGPYTTVGSPTTTSFADTSVSPATTYFYVVAAVNASGSSALSTQVSALTMPAAPTGLAATPASASQINLAWNAVTGAASYTVQRSTTSGGPYTTVGSPTTASFADTTVSANTVYFYVVAAVNASGSSALSAQVSATSALAAPTGVTATAASTTQINLAWTAVSGATSYTVQRSTTSGGPYTTVGSPTTASFADTGLSPGTAYFYVVQAVNGSGSSASSAQVSAVTVPAAPTGVAATAASATGINLTWTAVTGAASYTVQRSTTSGGPYTTVGSPTTAGFSDTGLTAATTYFYVVQAVDASGTSASSVQVSALTLPTAPTGLTATATSATQISLSWTAVTGASSYTVQRSTTSGGPYTTVGSPTTASFADSGLTAGTTYFYVVQAVNASGPSASSAQASATTVPPAPTGVAATAASATGINLTWTAVTGAASYTVQRSTTSGGPYTTVGSPTTAGFSDTGLTASTTYFYVVQAVNAAGSSASSTQVSALTLPAAPTGLTATATSATQISLSWTAVTGASSYTVQRSTTSGGPYTTVGSPTTASFADSGLTAGTTYFYVVQAVNASGSSASSAQASATTVPPAPTGLTATAASATGINLTWNAVSGATSYTVQRSTVSGGPYTTVASPTTTSFADTGLTANTTYFYVVQAVNAAGSSVSSAQVSALTMPTAPTGLTATATSATQIGLSWTAVTGASSYTVQRSTTSGGPYTTVGSVATASFSDTGLTAGTTYFYVVQGVNASGASASSAQASAITIAAAPTGLTATAVSATQVNLTWTAVTGAASYTVQRSNTSGGPYTTVGSPTTASFSDTGLTGNTAYFYVVQAVNASGSSASSAQASATTALAAPTGLAATGTSASQINLTWNAVSGATSYAVQRSTVSGGPYTTVGSPTTTSFSDTGLSPATTYFYVVQAANASGSSAPSAQASGLTMPAAPTGVAATPASTSQVNLTWNAVTGAASYTVQRSTTSGGPYTTVGSPATTGFSDTGLAAGTTYFYVVAAVNASGSSTLSTQVSALTMPAAPTGVVATGVSTSQINLTWTAATGASSYTVQRATVSGGPYTTLASVSVTSFADIGLTPGTTYFYVLQAVNASGPSASSTQVSAITVPAAPTGVAATAASASGINLSWNAVTGAASYTVQRSTTSGGPYTTVGSPTTASFSDTGLSAATTYFYVVQAVDASGSSASSSQVSALTMPAAPTGVVATGTSAAQVNLTWTAVTGAASYTVQRSTTSGGPYSTVGSVATASFSDTGLTAGTTYYYVVQAVNASGSSASSAQASAITVAAAPTGVTATATSATQINLTWTAVTGAASYTVQRSTTSGGPYTTVGSPTTTSFADTTVSAGTTYFYVVQAVNASGSSASSAQVSALTMPTAPTGLNATATSASQINLTWTAVTGASSYTVQRSTTSGGPYTTVGSGATPSFSDTGLTAGTTYFYVVQAVNASGSSASSAQASAITVAAAPTGVAATAASASQVNLTWTAVSGAASYTVQRATVSGGPYATVGSPTTTTFGDSGLSPATTYFYVVQAVNASGSSASSTQVSALTMPAAPTGVAATATSASQINLTWNAVTGASSYTVQRSTTSGGPYTTVGSPSTATFSDTALTAGTTYFYVVQAVNASGPSVSSAQASAITVPAAPTGVTATPASTTQVNLAWSAVTGAASYTVQRATVSGGPYTTVGSPTTTSFPDTGLTGATTYFYVVQAVNASGTSASSAQVSALTMPAAPTGVAATGASTTQINLTWSVVSGASSYTVQRSTTTGGPYTTVGSPTTATFSDTGLTAGTTYFYVVQAVNASGSSASSAEASAITLPAAPTGVAATVASSTRVNLAWSAVTGAASYTVQRATTSGGPYTTVGSPTTTSFADTTLSAGTTYFYVVQAVNASGSSASSAQVSALTIPAAPTGVVATAASTSQINLTWNAMTGAASYTVQRSTTSGGPYTTVGSPTTASFGDSALTAGTTYFYVVQAVNASGSSGSSAEASAITLAAAPTGVAATAASATQINLTWNAVTSATSYTVKRATTTGGPYTTVGSPTTASFGDTGLTAGTTYFYVVQAVNASGSSASSSEVSALTMPAAPTGVAATAASTTQINLTWNAVTSATSYTVKRATTTGGPYTTVGSPTTASFGDTGLTAGTTYFYVVQAVNASGSSALSTEVSAATIPAAPTGVTATAVAGAQINLTWTAVTGATSYTLERALVSGGPYTVVGSPTTASFSDTGLTAGTTYFYVVLAVNASGSSAPSAQASATATP
jgi:fibronectin type 3 domain-containing protein